MCRRLGCNIEVASSCCTGYGSTHCFSRRCSCIRPVAEEPRATPQLHSTSIDLVLASRGLAIRNVVVHDGLSCACPEGCCCPALNSDHRLITFHIALTPTSVEDVAQFWPVVRDWRPVVRALRVRRLDWSEKILNLFFYTDLFPAAWGA